MAKKKELKVRALMESEVRFTVEIMEEDMSVEGAFSTDEPEEDEKLVAEIKERLERGDQWAWCVVKVTATWNGISAFDTLGGCSYKNIHDFTQEGGYYGDMKSQALDALNERIASQFRQIRELVAA